MKKLLYLQIVIIHMAVFSILTPNIFADEDVNNITTSGIALIAHGIGDFTCGNGTQSENMEIFVLLSETTIMGLDSSPSGLGLKSQDSNENIAIKLNFGEINADKFYVEGNLHVDSICELDSSIIFTADGSCGNNQQITVKGSDGSFGTFQSEVICR